MSTITEKENKTAGKFILNAVASFNFTSVILLWVAVWYQVSRIDKLEGSRLVIIDGKVVVFQPFAIFTNLGTVVTNSFVTNVLALPATNLAMAKLVAGTGGSFADVAHAYFDAGAKLGYACRVHGGGTNDVDFLIRAERESRPDLVTKWFDEHP